MNQGDLYQVEKAKHFQVDEGWFCWINKEFVGLRPKMQWYLKDYDKDKRNKNNMLWKKKLILKIAKFV